LRWHQITDVSTAFRRRRIERAKRHRRLPLVVSAQHQTNYFQRPVLYFNSLITSDITTVISSFFPLYRHKLLAKAE
jgi:hypothetical protein